MLLTLREGHGNGLSRVKAREWNSDALLLHWHQQWEIHTNRALELAGHAARVDHRSLLDQRDAALERGDENAARSLDRLPQIAIGPEAVARHRRGVPYRPKPRLKRKRSQKKEPPKGKNRESRIEQNKRLWRHGRCPRRPGKRRRSLITASGRSTACRLRTAFIS